MTFGPSFGEELARSGLAGLPFGWSGTGQIVGRANLTAEQQATLDRVIAEHVPLNGVKAQALAEIDSRHAEVTRRYLTPGVDYSRKLREAEYVADTETPDPALCPMLMAGVGITVPSSGNVQADLEAIAALVRRKDAETAAALAPLDHVRHAAKAAIRAATTTDEIESVLASTTFRGL